MQIILDPSDTSLASEDVSLPTLPPAARQFGFLPNVRKCLPGDLVLYAAVDANAVGREITRSQKLAGFADEHAKWTHAAVFLFDDFIVEAIPGKGVVTRTIYEDVPGKLIRVRRDMKLSEPERYRIALRALRMLGDSYSHVGIWKLAQRMWRGIWNGRGVPPEEQNLVICSKVFADSYMDEKRSTLEGCPINFPATPAHLSATKDLSDQNVGWLKIS